MAILFCVTALLLYPIDNPTKKLTYDDLVKFKSGLAIEDTTLIYPRIEITPGMDQDGIYFTHGRVTNIHLNSIDPWLSRYVYCLNLISLEESYVSLLAKNGNFKEYLSSLKSECRKAIDIVNDTGLSEDEKSEKLSKLSSISKDEFDKAFRQYCKDRNFILQKRSSVPIYQVDITTDPPNAKVCMLSVLEYELAKLTNRKEEELLSKSVVASLKKASLSGRYVYRLYWNDGKKSEIGKINIAASTEYILK